MKAKLGIAPIAWWNDDLAELSDDVSLEECLRQASVAGFTGMETGRRFPMDMAELGPILTKYGISVCGGWFSGLLLEGDIGAEKDRIAAQHAFFKAAGAPCIVYGETARSVQGIKSAPLATKPKLTEAEIAEYGRKISDFADWCAKEGMPLSYHHHMAAAIETEAELDLLMKHSTVPLLFDAGHMAFAGGDNLRVIENHWKRITHVHTKDIRRAVVDGLDRSRESFLDAVAKGAFTVPGDGSLDFGAIVKALAATGYDGWFVVEAEQDPKVSPPLEMAIKGHKELMRVMAAAGYEVVLTKFSGNRMDGKVCVITGATQGLGAAIARALAAAGGCGHCGDGPQYHAERGRGGRAFPPPPRAVPQGRSGPSCGLHPRDR